MNRTACDRSFGFLSYNAVCGAIENAFKSHLTLYNTVCSIVIGLKVFSASYRI